MSKTAIASKRPPASKKAAAENAKREQPAWLRRKAAAVPVLASDPPPAAHPQGPPRLLDKREVHIITGVTFPTIWNWMRAGAFPRSRIVGGKSMWLSTEIDAWLATLPMRPLKGDAPLETA